MRLYRRGRFFSSCRGPGQKYLLNRPQSVKKKVSRPSFGGLLRTRKRNHGLLAKCVVFLRRILLFQGFAGVSVWRGRFIGAWLGRDDRADIARAVHYMYEPPANGWMLMTLP